MDKLTMVKDFMFLFGQKCPDKPCIPDTKTQMLRLKLHREEDAELTVGFLDHDLIEVMDALCDLLYVIYGTAAACGIDQELLDKNFQRVHENNLQKLWTTGQVERAMDFIVGSLDEKLVASYNNVTAIRQTTNSLWKVTAADGKILKPMGYEKVKLTLSV